MALANYADLLAAVAGWLNRGDLTATIPDFIRLAEAEFNRKLRTIEMEVRSTSTLVSDALAVPADFIGLRSIAIENTALAYVPPAEIFDDTSTGTYPTRYTISDGQFFFRPAPTSGDVVIAYYASIPALTGGNTTNWLMTKYPDLYLFATLAHAAFYIRDPEMTADCQGRAEALIEQINMATNKERYGGARLVARHRVPVLSQIRA